MIPDHPHRGFLNLVERPARYAGPEHGAARIPEAAEASLALAFPDVYEVGCSNLGITILYRIVERLGWARVERAFAPWPDYARELADRGLPLLSRETARPLASFDVVGFSLQHELTYTTVLWMLGLSGIPARSADRRDGHPLIVAGGPAAWNPEPISAFVDAVVPGDGEEAIVGILGIVRQERARGKGRTAMIEEIAGQGLAYVPSMYERGPGPGGRRVVVGARKGAAAPARLAPAPAARLRGAPIPLPVVPAMEAVFDRIQIEVARGCSAGCRFCHAGFTYRPVRERSPGEVVEAVVASVIATGYDEVSLASLSTADHPALSAMASALAPILDERRIALSVPSLRAYGLPNDVLAAIRAVRMTGMTLAPEAGSQRLRDVVCKNVTRADLVAALERLGASGWQKAKLYFMIGLPTETDADIAEIAELLAEAARALRVRRRGGRRKLSASVACFVPKPFTPFEREAFLPPEALGERIRALRGLVRALPVTISFHDPGQSRIEALLARGGEEMCGVLGAAASHGARLDGWSDHFDPAAWDAAIAEAGVVQARQWDRIAPAAPLPWDVIDGRVSREFLAGERDRAARGEPSPRCDAPLGRECSGCGAPCDPDESALAGGDDSAAGTARARSALAAADAAAEKAWGPVGSAERHHLVLEFDRVRSAIYLGHRDVIRVAVQSLRRAGVPLAYSAGFTPRPRLRFRSALPVGVAGIGEAVCVETTRPLANGAVLISLLAAATPEGIVFRSARSISGEEARAIAAGPASVGWYAVLEEGTGMAEAVAGAEAIAGTAEITVERRMGDGISRLDVRPMIRAIRAMSVADVPDLASSGIDPGRPAITVEACQAGGRWIRPSEIAALLAGRGIGVALLARRARGKDEP